MAAGASIGNGLEQKIWGINFCYFNVGTNLDDVIGTRARNNAIRLCGKIQDRKRQPDGVVQKHRSGHGTWCEPSGF
jgi:hypothetical protein